MTLEISPLSLHDALPISNRIFVQARAGDGVVDLNGGVSFASQQISSYADLATTPYVLDPVIEELGDRKSTRLNSSHVAISYAVFCLKKNRRNVRLELARK